MDKILHDLIYLSYGIYGTMLYLCHAEFCPSTVVLLFSVFDMEMATRLLQQSAVLRLDLTPRLQNRGAHGLIRYVYTYIYIYI